MITNDFLSNLKIGYTKLTDWIKVITLLYEKTLNQSTVDKKIVDKEGIELKKIHNHYLDKRNETMINTELKVEDMFGVICDKETISPEQIT